MIEQWQELKETITELRDNDGTGTQQEICEFLANYMDVLEKQMQEPSEDAISRQVAIDAFERFIHELGIKDEPYNYGEMALSVENVPPVIPQMKDEDVAKAFQIGMALGFGEKYDEMDRVIDEINKKVVTPRQKTGYWRPIYQGDEIIGYRCSECEFGRTESIYRANYCHNCGAKMVEPREISKGLVNFAEDLIPIINEVEREK